MEGQASLKMSSWEEAGLEDMRVEGQKTRGGRAFGPGPQGKAGDARLSSVAHRSTTPGRCSECPATCPPGQFPPVPP